MFSGPPIGPGGNHKRGHMGAHVPAISKEGHGVQFDPADDLGYHHDSGQKDHPAGVLFGRSGVASEIMRVPPSCHVGGMHAACILLEFSRFFKLWKCLLECPSSHGEKATGLLNS